MANRNAHQLAAALFIGSVCLHSERNQQNATAKPLVGAMLGAALTNLPDILEPAHHPNHRQFFHSVAFASALGVATQKAFAWKTNCSRDEAIRFTLLVGAGAYFVHLLLDANTPKSLPLLGGL